MCLHEQQHLCWLTYALHNMPFSPCFCLCSFLLPITDPFTLQVYRAAQPDAKKQGINPTTSDPSVSVAQIANSESPIAAPSLSPPGKVAVVAAAQWQS